MTRITPSSIVSVIPKRIIVILRITVLWSISVVGGKFGTVVWRDERLIESLPRRGSLWRREIRVVSIPARIGLLRVSPERILVLSANGVCRTGWVQELFVVAEDDEEEESSQTDFDEEGENIRPSAPVPGSITPCARRGG